MQNRFSILKLKYVMFHLLNSLTIMCKRKKLLLILCFPLLYLQAQKAPSVDLLIKETSGFLGLGGSRIIKIELSNKEQQLPLNSQNVNGNSLFFFLLSPSNDWQLTEDFIEEELKKIYILQDGEKTLLNWRSPLIVKGNNSVLFGFPKTFKLYRPFYFQYQFDKEIIRKAEFKVPQEYWPGYDRFTNLVENAEKAFALNEYKNAIRYYEQILADSNLSIFTQFEDIKNKRNSCFRAYSDELMDLFQKVKIDTQSNIRYRISTMDKYRNEVKYIMDSLPRLEWEISSLDTNVSPILSKCRDIFFEITTSRDSLQQILDDQLTRWIVEGSIIGKDELLYTCIIEALAMAFSSLDFADTLATSLNIVTPDEYIARLEKNNILESYNTFIRICQERFKMHLPIFPINFLPNLRKDTSLFSLPYYSMLKAVNDYYYGDWNSAKKEILQIFKTCYEPSINSAFDMMRVVINQREKPIPAEVTKLLAEAIEMEKANNLENAKEKYQQALLIAPDYAYGYFLQGKFFSRINDYIRAIHSFQQAFKFDTLYLTAYRECYHTFLKQSNFTEVINVYTTALSKGNNYYEVNYNLGIAYLGQADPAKAIHYFQQALALNPKSYRANIQLGLAYQNMKNYQKAREYFNNAISLDPMRQEAIDYLTKLNEIQRASK